MTATLDRVGFVRDVIVNRRSGHVLDGHMRVELALRRGEATVPVSYVDLDPEEEALVLATFDPVANLALADTGKLRALRDRAGVADEDVLAGLIGTALSAAGDPDDLPMGVEEHRGREATMDAYLNGDQRQIHLPLLAAEYQTVSRALAGIRERIGAERNAQALLWLLEQDAHAS